MTLLCFGVRLVRLIIAFAKQHLWYTLTGQSFDMMLPPSNPCRQGSGEKGCRRICVPNLRDKGRDAVSGITHSQIFKILCGILPDIFSGIHRKGRHEQMQQ